MEKEKQVRLTDDQVVKKVDRLTELKGQLDHSRKATGFKKLAKKSEQKLSNQIQELALVIANEYQARYKELCQLFTMELKPAMRTNQYQPNVAQAVIELKPYAPKSNTKPWHEAMAENLKTRAKCVHVLHDEGNICEKCGLNPENWSETGKGVKHEYFTDMEKKISAEKKIQEEADAEEKE